MIVQLVAQGAGIALDPHIALVGDRHRVAIRELPPPPPAFDVFAIVRAAGLRNPAVAATVAALRQAAAEVRGPAGAVNMTAAVARSSGWTRSSQVVPTTRSSLTRGSARSRG
jgi:hypothetical protein